MQLKLSIGDIFSNGKPYVVSVSCNKCKGTHDLGVSVTMTDGPIVKQSIASLFDGKELPKVLSDLTGNSVTYSKTEDKQFRKTCTISF